MYTYIYTYVYRQDTYPHVHRDKINTGYISTVYLAVHYEAGYKYRHTSLKWLLRHNSIVSDHTMDVSYELFPFCFTWFFT